MYHEEFKHILDTQLSACKNTLETKATEYATEDRLHNFKKAAHLQGITPRQALAGMMAKHTVSVYDMLMSKTIFTRAQWDEKITDSINYHILGLALVQEELNEQAKERAAESIGRKDAPASLLEARTGIKPDETPNPLQVARTSAPAAKTN